MATYLYGLDAAPALEKPIWWLHALLIMGFVPLILHSKHFHIIVSPINVFLRNQRLGQHLPLDLEAIAEAEEETSLRALDRAEKHNAMSSLMMQELRSAIGMLDQDASVRAVVLAGNGKSFCAGALFCLHLQQT